MNMCATNLLHLQGARDNNKDSKHPFWELLFEEMLQRCTDPCVLDQVRRLPVRRVVEGGAPPHADAAVLLTAIPGGNYTLREWCAGCFVSTQGCCSYSERLRLLSNDVAVLQGDRSARLAFVGPSVD